MQLLRQKFVKMEVGVMMEVWCVINVHLGQVVLIIWRLSSVILVVIQKVNRYHVHLALLATTVPPMAQGVQNPAPLEHTVTHLVLSYVKFVQQVPNVPTLHLHQKIVQLEVGVTMGVLFVHNVLLDMVASTRQITHLVPREPIPQEVLRYVIHAQLEIIALN